MKTQNEKIQDIIKEFSKDKDVIQVVKHIESRIKTTQNHYGDYMSFLTNCSKDKVTLYIMSEALKLAGGNIQGINSARQILTN